MGFGADVVDVLTVIAGPVAVQGGVGGWWDGVGEWGEVIVDPVGAAGDVELVDVVVGADVVDVLTVIAEPVAVQGGVGGWWDGVGACGEVVVDPVGAAGDVELVDVVVGADVVDVLAVVAESVAVQGGVGGWWDGVGACGEVVVDPVGAAGDVELVDVVVGADVVAVLAVVAEPVAVQGGVGGWWDGVGACGEVIVDPVGAAGDVELVDVV